MSYDTEIDNLITTYLTDAGISSISVSNMSRGLRVWTWWQALAYYKMQNHYASLDDVPDDFDGDYFVIMGEREKIEYRLYNGKWKSQKMTFEDCGKIYGN